MAKNINNTDTDCYLYDVKCRRCGTIKRMWFGTMENVSKVSFRIWVSEHSTFPIESQCDCDNGMMMLHDIVAFGNILNI